MPTAILTTWPRSPRVRWNEDRTGGFLPGLGQFRLAPGVTPEEPTEDSVPSVPSCSDLPRPRPRWISTQQLVTDTQALIPRLPADLSAIVGVARSGMLPATIIATSLHLPLYALDQERRLVRDVGHGWRLTVARRSTMGRKVLVVDDTTGSGRSLRMTQQALRSCAGCPFRASDVLTASVYCNPLSERRPDLWSVDLHLPHFLQWNFANSIVADVCAFDLDGVILHDAESGGQPGTPLHLPRRRPVHIITGRPERHRARTLLVLDRLGVRVASLTMLPDEVVSGEITVADDKAFADYKAEHVARFAATSHERPYGPPTYVESCPRQAARIAELSGVLTVCPLTAEVFGPDGSWL